ncbi:MAG: 2-oxo acid dehydrogenase subunit E2, partial [Prolixibacteraceae bacterium]
AAKKQPESVEENSEIKASPLVKNIARVKSIDLSRVSGTGPNRRIVKKDIDAYLKGDTKQPPKKDKKTDIKTGTPDYTGLTSNQLAVARTVSESLRTIPTVSFKVKIDMQNIIQYREAHSKGNKGKISYDSILIHEVVQTLNDFPKLCNTILEGEYIENDEINLGLAIGVGTDLFTPVLKKTGEKSVRELSNEISLLAAKANQQRLTLEELNGGNFLFSNLGMYPVLEFNAIIPPGYGASLAVGAINDEATVINKAVAIRPVCTLTLSTDHRIVNGREAAEFLQQLKYNLEELKL